MSVPLRFAAAFVAALALPGSALAGTLTLHPAGFGQHSYASWKAQQGEPDFTSTGDHIVSRRSGIWPEAG